MVDRWIESIPEGPPARIALEALRELSTLLVMSTEDDDHAYVAARRRYLDGKPVHEDEFKAHQIKEALRDDPDGRAYAARRDKFIAFVKRRRR
jgi:hypothetical protein